VKTYALFISHAWTINAEYDRLVALLEGAPALRWHNLSSPRLEPAKGMRAAFEQQIRPADAVLVLAGMFVNYRRWVLDSIEIAQAEGKPILAVVPAGPESMPRVIADAAVAIVDWDTDAIVRAIVDHAL
jgi:hypothetical protein